MKTFFQFDNTTCHVCDQLSVLSLLVAHRPRAQDVRDPFASVDGEVVAILGDALLASEDVSSKRQRIEGRQDWTPVERLSPLLSFFFEQNPPIPRVGEKKQKA